MAVKLIISSTCNFKGTVIAYVKYYFSKNLISVSAYCIKTGQNETHCAERTVNGGKLTEILFISSTSPYHITCSAASVFSHVYGLSPFCHLLLSENMENIRVEMGRCEIYRTRSLYLNLVSGMVACLHLIKRKLASISFFALEFCTVQHVRNFALAPKELLGNYLPDFIYYSVVRASTVLRCFFVLHYYAA